MLRKKYASYRYFINYYKVAFKINLNIKNKLSYY